MAIKLLRRTVRKLGHRLGIMTDWESLLAPQIINGQEQPHQWYDEAMTAEMYRIHYSRSCYYFMWSVITDRILRDGLSSVLEIGCGPGQMAHLFHDRGVERYSGLDFSPAAVELAKKRVPSFRFIVGDALTTDMYEKFDHDVAVCTEVLEHLQDDLRLVSRFIPGKRCLFTVPNQPGESHVRFFKDADEVRSRYAPFFAKCDVSTLVGTRDLSERFYLLDGIRNERTC